MQIDITIARKVLEVVDAGLVSGIGNPIPGQMCVEAAVCYAMGLPHSDEPTCVSPSLRRLKIRLNDSNWSSDIARAHGLRRLAVAQLGSADVLDEQEFAHRVVRLARRVSQEWRAAAATAAYAAAAAAAAAADAYADAADAAAARDRSLAAFSEGVVQILIEMKAPGCQWLSLTEEQ